MNTYCKGILGIKINGKLHFMLAEKGSVLDFKSGKRLNHYKLNGNGYDVQYTKVKDFNVFSG